MLFCGIHLHSNNSFVVVTDDTDKLLYSRRLPNNLTDICGALSPYLKNLLGVVVESTFNWYWLVDGLIEAGHSVHLANTVAIKQYDGLKYRGDESDARHLAHILRLAFYQRGTSCRNPCARYATCRASARSWCSSAPPRSSQ
jgi:transposase